MTEQSLTRRKTDDAKQYLSEHLIEPFAKLRADVETMFDEFPARWPTLPNASMLTQMPVPAVELVESDTAYKVSVEVPGIEPDDVDLSVQEDMLIVKGEKFDESSESDRNHSRSERRYGAFERHITLPADAQLDAIEASSKNGVITIDIPRDKSRTDAARKIPINSN